MHKTYVQGWDQGPDPWPQSPMAMDFAVVSVPAPAPDPQAHWSLWRAEGSCRQGPTGCIPRAVSTGHNNRTHCITSRTTTEKACHSVPVAREHPGRPRHRGGHGHPPGVMGGATKWGHTLGNHQSLHPTTVLGDVRGS